MSRALIICHDNPVDPLGVMQLCGATPNPVDVCFIGKEPEELPLIGGYDIVGFSTLTGTHKLHSRIAARIKERYPHVTTIMGGPHPTFFPVKAAALPGIDLICVGEGVTAFARLMNGEDSPNITNLFGALGTFGGNLLPLKPADELWERRSSVYAKPERRHNPIRNFMGTFGCPFGCTYCFNDTYALLYPGEPRIRYRTPRLFVNSIRRDVGTWGAELLYMQDDTFIVNQGWFTAVVERIHKDIGLPYHCHVRCDLMTEKVAQTLHRTGCRSVTFAIEDADDSFRRQVLCRRMTNEDIFRTADLLHHYGIRFRIENMVGLPGNGLRENLATMRINAHCRPTIGWASLFQPYPSTVLGEAARASGQWSGDVNSINPSFFDTSPLDLPNKKEVERLQKLFSLAVDNWWVRLLAPLLVRLPLDGWYRKLYQRFKDKKYRLLFGR